MYTTLVLTSLFATSVMAANDRLSNDDPIDLWVKVLMNCGEKGRDENYDQAVKCQEHTEKTINADAGKNLFLQCDQEYCLCVKGTWANGECTVPDRCTDDCECMEQCYGEQLECSFDRMTMLYTTTDLPIDHCEHAKMTECVRATKGALISECKRGVNDEPAQISWMREPMPQGCDAVLVCNYLSILAYC